MILINISRTFYDVEIFVTNVNIAWPAMEQHQYIKTDNNGLSNNIRQWKDKELTMEHNSNTFYLHHLSNKCIIIYKSYM